MLFRGGGTGAFIADVSTDQKRDELWRLRESDWVIEEKVNNIESICSFYQDSLNTIKVVTLNIHGIPVVQTALFRMGNNSQVDNVHSGGICALVDIDCGIVVTEGVDNHFRRYLFHPVSGKQILGFKIPMWESVLALAKEAASRVPELRYTSWDIALTERGAVLIEGNWDAEFYPEQMLMGKGLRKKYIRLLGGDLNDNRLEE